MTSQIALIGNREQSRLFGYAQLILQVCKQRTVFFNANAVGLTGLLRFINPGRIGNARVDFLKEGMVVDVVSDASTETILFADLPVKVQLKITYSEPGVKGDTATNATKPATLETGAVVRVPLFINEGETIEVDTRDGSYVNRVKA